MSYQDLRDFLKQLETSSQVIRISQPVSPHLEMTALSVRVLHAGGPALLFEKPTGHTMPVLTNLFGTTYYSLVGFHAFHVIVGLCLLTSILVLSLMGHIHVVRDHLRVELVSWYWHFVDAVWIVVFTTVYIVGMRP